MYSFFAIAVISKAKVIRQSLCFRGSAANLLKLVKWQLYTCQKVILGQNLPVPSPLFYLMRKLLLSFSVLLYTCTLQGQTLVNIGSAKVSVPEFLWVYKKGSGNEAAPQPDMRTYLDLYIRYRMKVLDAESLGLDKEPAFREELLGYRNQLASRYLLEREVSDKLVKEAYQRSLKFINASHILIQCAADAPATDTLKAYEKISLVRNKAIAGVSFEELAAAYSEEPGAAERKGNLGNFSVFQMLYPFETAAYHTAEGQISGVVRTRYGYHLIKVNEVKINPGQVEIGSIKVSVRRGEPESEAEEKVLEIYNRLIKGADFYAMRDQFSDEKNSVGTEIIKWGSSPGKALEAAAFALKKTGDISAPIRTSDGWYILRLVRKLPVPSFEKVKARLTNRVAGDERSEIGREQFILRLKKQYKFKEDESVKGKPEALTALLSEADKHTKALLFTFDKERVMLPDFQTYLKGKASNASVEQRYKDFIEDKLTVFENEHLEEKYPDFRYLLNEYRNGILLFNLSEQKIWNQGRSDSTRLLKFYNSRIKDYSWKERAEASVYLAGSANDLSQVKEMLKENKSDQEIIAVINRNNPLNLVIDAGLFERGSHMFVDRARWQNNTDSEIAIGNAFALVRVTRVLPASAKDPSLVEGALLSDYQDYLESEWLKELKLRYPVRINEIELKKIASKYGEKKTPGRH